MTNLFIDSQVVNSYNISDYEPNAMMAAAQILTLDALPFHVRILLGLFFKACLIYAHPPNCHAALAAGGMEV